MANRDLEINVKYAPDDDSLATENTGANPTTGNQVTNKNLLKGFVVAQAAFSAVSRVSSTAIGQIGEVTGNRPLQRKVENFSRIVGYATFAYLNPVFAAVSIGTELAAEGIQREVQARNENIQAQYFRNLYGSKYNNSRR